MTPSNRYTYLCLCCIKNTDNERRIENTREEITAITATSASTSIEKVVILVLVKLIVIQVHTRNGKKDYCG